jgi:hypothetical protein
LDLRTPDTWLSRNSFSHGSSVEILSRLVPDDAIIVDPSDSLAGGDAVQVMKPRG